MLYIYGIGILFIAFINTLIQAPYIKELSLLVVMFTYWNVKKKNKYLKLVFLIIISIHALYNISHIYKELKLLSSDSKNASEYIKNNIPKNSDIYCEDPAICTAIIPYLNSDEYRFIDINTNKEFTYVKWDEYYANKKNNWDNNNCEYYITMMNARKSIPNYDLVYETSDNLIWNDAYYIFKRNIKDK